MKIDYSSLHTHFIFTTKDRLPLIPEQHRERIEKYISGIVKNSECKMCAIYANPEHMHMVVSRSPAISEEQLATVVAESSTKFINENRLCKVPFEWQESASAFSVSKSALNIACKYVRNQGEHHKKVSFQQEYDLFVKNYMKRNE